MTEDDLLDLLAAAKLHSTSDGALQDDPLKFLALFASIVEDRCNRANHLCEALNSISLGAQNSATSKEDLGKQARAALERHVSTQQPKQSKVLTPAEIEEIAGPDFLKDFVNSLDAEEPIPTAMDSDDLIPAPRHGIRVTEYCVDNEPSEAVGLRVDPESRIGEPLFFLIEQGAKDEIAVTLECLQGLTIAAQALQNQRI